MDVNEVLEELERRNEDVVAQADEAAEKKARTPQHVRNFYGRMRLDEKGVWGDSQMAKSMKALMLREQNVVDKSFGAMVNERFGRRDRKHAVNKLVREGKAAKVVPRNVKETAGTIHPATVDAMLESLPDAAKDSPDQLTATFARLFKFKSQAAFARFVNRAGRFMIKHPGRRMPMHIREGAMASTAVACAIVKLFPETCTPETLLAVQKLREQHGMEVA